MNLGLHIAGPLAGRLLAGAGAEVIQVLPPEHLLPEAQIPRLVHGMQYVRLDLKTEPGCIRLFELLSNADVLIEGFRPAVMGRLGLGLADLRARFPALITCSIPGFARNDPRSGQPGWESGILAVTGALRSAIADVQASLDGDAPRVPTTPIASNFAALIAVVSTVSALIERQRSGSGQGIEISLFDAMFEAIGDVGTWFNGNGPDRGARDRFGGGTYRCSDGRWVQFNTQNPEFLVRLCRGANLFADNPPNVDLLRTDPDYRANLKGRLQKEFSRHPAEWWERIALETEIALVACRTLDEWRKSAHALQSEMVTGPGGAVLRSPGVRFTRGRVAAERRRQEETVKDEAENHPLKDVRIIDVSHYLAGPSAARFLAQLGADVVKIIEPNLLNLHKHDYVNRGKRSILCDLKNESGQALLHALVRGADVFIHNFLPATQRRLKVSRKDIHEVNAAIVYAAVSAFGESGDLSSLPGYETQGQAVSGMMLNRNADRPELHPVPVNDYGTGLTTAFGVVCSLYSASRNRVVYDVEASLARTATLFQACVSPERKSDTTRYGASHHLELVLKARDQWICISGPGRQVCNALIHDHCASGEWPVERVTEIIASRGYAYWQKRFAQTQVSVNPVKNLVDVMESLDLRRRGVVSVIDCGVLGGLTVPEPGVRFSRSSVLIGAPHTVPGSHAAEIVKLGDRSLEPNSPR